MPTVTQCPCCPASISVEGSNGGYITCSVCGHRWREAGAIDQHYYRNLAARNDTTAPWFERKTNARLNELRRLLEDRPATNLLEIGCAEGFLGERLKRHVNLVYDGIELSRDAILAQSRLDRVFPHTASSLGTKHAYDVIVSFHVLEHIESPHTELSSWTALLGKAGRLLIEVPNGSGHPLLENDGNPEHLHQFSPASLTQLVQSHGYSIRSVTTDHYESPVYPDCIQLLAERPILPQAKRAGLLNRFRQCLGEEFFVYGIGGDFANYVAPLANVLSIKGLLDSSPEKHGQYLSGHTVEAYNPALHADRKILICSIMFGSSIRKGLLELGVPPNRLVGLEEIYGDTPSGR